MAASSGAGQPTSSKLGAHLLIIAAVTAVISWPVMVHGLPDLGNDSINHARSAKHFGMQFWEGELYPRWLSGTNAGLGAPIFFIYPPMPFYVAALFHPLVSSADPVGYRSIGWSVVLSVFLSGIVIYFWCRSFASPAGSLFAAVISLLAPYHIAVNLFTRGAVSELWAVVWMPLAMWSAERIAAGFRWAPVSLAVSYGLLMFTHLPTTVCFSLVPLGAAVYFSPPSGRLRNLLRTAAAMFIGAGLAAAYWLTFVLGGEKNVRIESTRSGEFDYRRWWLFQVQPWYDARMRLLLLTLATLAFMAGALWLCWRFCPPGHTRKIVVFQCLVAVGTIFMCSQASAPIYRLLTPLQGLPFPTRFLQVLTLPLAALAALAFPYLRQSRLLAAVLAMTVFSWVVANAWAGSQSYSVWRKLPPQLTEYYRLVNLYERDYQAFWPRWTRMPEINEFPAFANYVAEFPPKTAHITDEAGNSIGSARIQQWRSRNVELQISAPRAAELTLYHFYYPGWFGHIQGSSGELTVTPSNPDGFVQLRVPEGTYTLDLTLGRTSAELAGIWTSLAALVALALMALWLSFRPAAQGN